MLIYSDTVHDECARITFHILILCKLVSISIWRRSCCERALDDRSFFALNITGWSAHRILCWFSTDNCAQLKAITSFSRLQDTTEMVIKLYCIWMFHSSSQFSRVMPSWETSLNLVADLLIFIIAGGYFASQPILFLDSFVCWNGFNWRTVICVADEWFGFTCKLPRHKQRFRFDIAKYRLQTKRARHENHRIANEP